MRLQEDLKKQLVVQGKWQPWEVSNACANMCALSSHESIFPRLSCPESTTDHVSWGIESDRNFTLQQQDQTAKAVVPAQQLHFRRNMKASSHRFTGSVASRNMGGGVSDRFVPVEKVAQRQW